VLPTNTQSGLFQIVWTQDLGLFIKQALLLIEGEQVAQKEQIGFGLVGLILQVEDTKVLAVAIPVKVPVGVIKDDGLAVFGSKRIVARRRESLPKGCAVFKGETCFAKCIAVLAPSFAAGAFVPSSTKIRLRPSNASTGTLTHHRAFLQQV